MSGLRLGGFGGRGSGDMDCDRAEKLAPDLALGLLDGAERAAVLAHVDGCGSCRREVASLTELGEHLLLLAPEMPPPAGFESDVLGQLAPERRQRRRRRSRRVVGAAAAALLGLGGSAVVVESLRDGGGSGKDKEVADDDGPTRDDDQAASKTAVMRTGEAGDGEVVGETVLRQAGSRVQAELEFEEPVRSYYAETAASGEHTWWLAVYDLTGAHAMYPITFDAAISTVTLDEGRADDVAGVAVVDDAHRRWCSGDFES